MKLFKKTTHILNIRIIEKPIFFTLNTKEVFNYLYQAFIKTLIFQHFNLKEYI